MGCHRETQDGLSFEGEGGSGLRRRTNDLRKRWDFDAWTILDVEKVSTLAFLTVLIRTEI